MLYVGTGPTNQRGTLTNAGFTVEGRRDARTFSTTGVAPAGRFLSLLDTFS